jgi:Zn-dependent peptidase ImmA (M78 family)/transcriptional regulator with XRE-family HTH domain
VNESSLPPIGPQDVHLAAQLFRPSRLTLARELRGLTKVELAAKIDKTPSAVSQFEGARTKPDAQTVARLALALQVPLAFFARRESTPTIQCDACNFRSLRSATQRDRRKLLASGSLLCDLVALIEELVEFPAEAVPRATGSVTSTEQIETLANEVRSAWGLGVGPIQNIIDLLEAHGVIVMRVPDDCRAVDAFSTWNGGRPLIFLVSDAEDDNRSSRLRFDAAHELGHLVMHADAMPSDRRIEAEANRFAAAFLMPAASFGPECPRRIEWSHVFELKRRWRVSAAAIIRRAHDLGHLSDASYRRACVELNKAGYRFREPDEPPRENPRLLMQALDLAAQVRPLENLASLIGLAPSELSTLAGLMSTAEATDNTQIVLEREQPALPR